MDHQLLLQESIQHCDLEQYDEAASKCQQFLVANPSHGRAWLQLGIIYRLQNRPKSSIAAYRQAIRFLPNSALAHNNLGDSYRMIHEYEEALVCHDKALALQPDFGLAHLGKAMALYRQGHVEAALASFLRGYEQDPNNAETNAALGIIDLLKGNFEEGWAKYEWRWHTKKYNSPDWQSVFEKACGSTTSEAFLTSPQRWTGDALDGKTILLIGEQGLGDTIQFARYAQRLKSRFQCHIIVACQKRLFPLLGSCPGIDQLVDRRGDFPDFDVYVPLASIPLVLQDNADTFSVLPNYLSADSQLEQLWKTRLASYTGLRIGIAWQGNPQYISDHQRSIPLREFLPLNRLSGIHWFSLQHGHGVEQLNDIRDLMPMVEFDDSIDQAAGAFMDTAAILKNLDLVITSDSAIAHLVGALGVPIWLLLPEVPDWRWQLQEPSSAWYPSMRLFRQPKMGDWKSVFQQVFSELRQYDERVGIKSPEKSRVASQEPHLRQINQLYRSGQLVEAAKLCTQILQQTPEQGEAWFYLGVIRCEQDQFLESIAAYQQAIRFRPNHEPSYNNLGESYRLNNELDRAIACYDQAIRLRPNYFLAHKGKGMALFRQGRVQEALQAFLQASQIEPQNAEARMALGICYLLQGNFAEGWREYEWRWYKEDTTYWKTIFSRISQQPTAEAFMSDPRRWQGDTLDGKNHSVVGRAGIR